MTQSARQEEVHYCARCRAIVADEESAETSETVSQEIEREPEAEKDRDSGVMPTTSLRGEVVDPPPATLPMIPIAVVPHIESEVALESAPQTMTDAAPAPDTEPELRAAPRRQVEVDVGIHSDSHFFAGITGDVSRGGLFVATYADIAVGSKITLDFELPNGRIIAEGTVRWLRSARDHHSPGFGVQFEEVDPAMMKLIERFCQARPPLYYDQADDV